jgi:predicted phosphodiesterase
VKLLVVSDPHWAGPAEQVRRGYESRAIPHPLQRALAAAWRRGFWLADPLAHNDKLERIIALNPAPDLVVANGDYSVDSAFVGLADDACCDSAERCLATLRTAYGERLLAVAGDHELGKHSLFGGVGGPRFESWRRLGSRLSIPAWWQRDLGRYRLISVPSTLVALPAFEAELLPDEAPAWWAERRRVLAEIAAAVASVEVDRRIVLFCHDPTALPFLESLPEVRAKLPQWEATIIGHLHSPAIAGLARLLAGMPPIRGLGSTVRRYSSALHRARAWEAFRVRLCPSPTGAQALKDGGWLTADWDPESPEPIPWRHHRLPW